MLLAILLAASGAKEYPAWEAVGPWGGSARVIRLDPGQPDVLMALTMRGTSVFRSEDAGRHWTELPGFPRLANARLDCGLIVRNPKPLWLVGAAPGGLWQSADEGLSWQLVAGTGKLSVFAIAAWAGDARVLAMGTNEGVWLSNDGAQTWRRISPKENVDMGAIVSVAFDPRKAGTLFAGTPHLPWKTINGGESWTRVATGMFDDSDIFSIAVDPGATGRVFASACSGIYCSLNGGTAWRRVQGIPGTNRRTYVVAQDPHRPARLYAGTSAGMWTSVDSGMTWRKLNEYVATSIAFHPQTAGRFYVSTERHGLLESDDGGATFETRQQGFVSRTLYGLTGDDKAVFAVANYEGLAGGIYRYGGRRGWEVVGRGHLFQNFLPGSDGRWLARDAEEGWLESRDEGQTWSKTEEPRLPATPNVGGRLFDWAIDPGNESIRLAATSEGLQRSTDGGATWSRVQNGLGEGWIQSVTFHPLRRGLCFALRHQRVFWSNDSGQHWYWLAAKEDGRVPFKLLRGFHATPDELWAMSEDRGVFRYDLAKNRVE